MKSGSMLWLAGALLLGGCAQGTVIANRDQVVVEDHTLREAVSLAEQRCGRFGRRAYFESEGRTTHAFSCREPRIEQAAKQRADIAPALGNAAQLPNSGAVSTTVAAPLEPLPLLPPPWQPSPSPPSPAGGAGGGGLKCMATSPSAGVVRPRATRAATTLLNTADWNALSCARTVRGKE